MLGVKSGIKSFSFLFYGKYFILLHLIVYIILCNEYIATPFKFFKLIT